MITAELFSGSDLPTACVSYAETLIGMNARQADRKLSKDMQSMLPEQRNELVPLARYLSKESDYGFKAGEIVRYTFSSSTVREGEILRIRNGYADFTDVIVPLSLVLPMDPEQIDLFDELIQ